MRFESAGNGLKIRVCSLQGGSVNVEEDKSTQDATNPDLGVGFESWMSVYGSSRGRYN
jgi:hypothetical protein